MISVRTNLPHGLWNRIAGFVIILYLVGMMTLSIYYQGPPRVLPENAPLTEFSAERAMRHIRIIARAPHPIGSQAHEDVRAYITKELSAMGVNPEVQTETGLLLEENWITAGTVRNIIAKIPGTGNTKAIMLSTHYDSVPAGPGASDDGSGVAALLEALRAIKAGPPVKNDLILLFTDGEEVGLIGAEAFVARHRWAKEIGITVNFEARGNCGPSILYETSDHNGGLIREFAKSTPFPFATSLAFEVYKRMLNGSDMTVFKKGGMAGLNFAYIDGHPAYHNRIDNPLTIDQRSLQHHGSYALSLARHFGNIDSQVRPGRDSVYFNIGPLFIHYSQGLIFPLLAIILVAFGAILFLGVRQKTMTLGGILWGSAAIPSSIIYAAGLVRVIWWGLTSNPNGYHAVLRQDTYNSCFYRMGFIALTIAITAAIFVWIRRRARLHSWAAGGLIWWMILSVLSGVYVPGASYLFFWPLLFGLAGLALLIFLGSNEERFSFRLSLLLIVCSLPIILLMAPTINLVYIALSLSASAPIIVMTVLTIGLLIPMFDMIMRSSEWLPAVLAAISSIGFIIAGSLTSHFDAQHPRPDSVCYVQNSDTGKAVWASYDVAPDPWTSTFIPPDASKGSGVRNVFGFRRQTAAPFVVCGQPIIEIVSDLIQNGERRLKLRLTGSPGTSFLRLRVSQNTGVRMISLNDRQLQSNLDSSNGHSPKSILLEYWAPSAEGIEFALHSGPTVPLKLQVDDVTLGLPVIPGRSSLPRPDDLMPKDLPFNDSTVVSKSFSL